MEKKESSFCGMEKAECLKYFAGNYRLMLKTLFALKLRVELDGIIRNPEKR
jgi:hypothetical protein